MSWESPSPEPRHPTLWYDPWIVLVVGVLVYGCLRQRTFYGPDGYADLRRIAAADWRSDMHLLFKPMLGSFAEIGASFGLTLYDSAVWLSVIGTAVGLAFCHAACRVLRVGRTESALIICLCGLSPALVFFATVVERHGIFFAFAGLCTWLAAHFSQRPGGWTALGLACGLIIAYAAHSTGVLMLCLLVPFAVARSRAVAGDEPAYRWRRMIVLSLGIGVVVVVGIKLAQLLGVWLGQVDREGSNLDWFLVLFRDNIARPSTLLPTVWQEWIYPFLPTSLLWLFAFRLPTERLTAIVVGIATVVYVFFAFAILGNRFDERGAYLLPLAWPFAFVVVKIFPRAIVWAALVTTACLAFVQVVKHDDRHLDDYALGMTETASEVGIYLVVGDPIDWESMFLFLPELRVNDDYWDVIDAGELAVDKAKLAMPLLLAFFDAKLAAGLSIVISDATIRYLEHPRFTQERWEAGPLILAALREHYEFTVIQKRAFTGVSLRPRR